jgi:hypothetical protein
LDGRRLIGWSNNVRACLSSPGDRSFYFCIIILLGKGERFDQVLDAYEDDDEKNVALVDALLGRTPSPTKRKAPAATEPDTQYLDSPGFMPPQSSKKRKPNAKDAVVDLTAED